MAIKINDENASSQPQPSAPQPPRPQAAPKPGIMEINALRRSAFGRFSVGETVESFKKAFEKMITDTIPAENRGQFILEAMNRDVDKVYMSTLLVMRNVAYKGKPYCVAFALPVEASNPIEDKRVFQNAGQTTEISWAPTDVLDWDFFGQMEKFVKSKMGEEVRVIYAGGRILPQELKSDDTQHLTRILFEVDQALLTAIEQNILETGPSAIVSVDMFLADNAMATVSIDPTPTDRDDSTGLPIRSDLNVQLRATKSVSNAQQNMSLNRRELDIVLARVDAYVDPVYDTRHLTQVQGNQWMGQRPPTQRFIPRVVITGLDSQVDILTPEISLLGLAVTTVLSQNPGNWANSLRPRHNSSRSADIQRMTDIGALGLVVPLNPNDPTDLRRVDTDPRNFGDRDFEALIEASFIRDPMYAMLVPESGERTWLNEVFQFAANGNQKAYQQIVRTADNLTNGQFSLLWNARGGGQIVYNDQNRVHMGYFVDSSGKRIDLQQVDTLAMLNLYGEKDPQTVWDWIQTFNPTTNTLEARIATREKILRDSLSQVTIKGYGRTVTFYADFLDTLLRAIQQAGLLISPANTRLNDFHTKPQFGVYDPAMFAVGAARTGGAFSYGQLNTNQNYRGIGGMMSGNFGY